MAALSCAFALASCGGDTSRQPTQTPPKTEPCAAGKTACGTSCCAAGETCVAETSKCEPPDSPQPGQLERCYAPASLPASGFTSEPRYVVDEEGYEYIANHKVDLPYAQMLSVALWPLSSATKLTGTFDLSKEPFSYETCERCVLVIAGPSEDKQKHYLAREGSLTISEVADHRISGTLSNVRLVEVEIDDETFETHSVEGGCSITIPSLAFSYEDEEEPVDERIAQCFLPETHAADAFRDFIYPYEANAYGRFYRATESPEKGGNLALFVEVHRDGTGSFPLAGAEVNCDACDHFVIIEAKTTSGKQKDYVSASGTLVLTELSDTVMAGRLENVTLVETVIQDGEFTPVTRGCSTFIERLEFSSRDETKL